MCILTRPRLEFKKCYSFLGIDSLNFFKAVSLLFVRKVSFCGQLVTVISLNVVWENHILFDERLRGSYRLARVLTHVEGIFGTNLHIAEALVVGEVVVVGSSGVQTVAPLRLNSASELLVAVS